MHRHRLRYSLYGVTFIVALVVVVAVSILQFQRDFDSTESLHLRAPRAGLLLDAGSAVKLRGVTVGHVDSVAASEDGAQLDLSISPDQLHLIPADAQARIVPPTLFGGKYVELRVPAGSDSSAISSGATIDVSHVTVEINDTFQHLMQLLDATDPAKVNAALSGLADALDGRGDQAGRLLDQIDTYLRQINPELTTLERDLALAKPVLDSYATLAPDLIDTARNLTTTSDSIQANRASLDAFLISLTSSANRTRTFVKQNQHYLTTTLDLLQPSTQVLAEYAPELPCFFKGLKYALPLAESAVGGKQPGLGVLSQFLPPEQPYQGSTDLPKIGADRGPRCYGLPNIPMGKQIPHQIFDVGTDPYERSSPKGGFTIDSLLELLFGPIKGGAS